MIAANVGRPFAIGGLEALCASYCSDKSEGKPNEFASSSEAMGKVRELREKQLQAYRPKPLRIVEDAEHEKEMGLDYTNRLLLELLQNADDAAAEESIGYKGLGFKAVLDISEHVRIESGHLRVRFDREESRKALLEWNLPYLGEVPVLRLPFWDDLCLEIPQLEGKYDTIVFLGWKSSADRNGRFAREWEAVSGDPTILLFLHAVEEVRWQRGAGDVVTWRCDRRSVPLKLSVQRGESAPKESLWRVFREHSHLARSAVAVRVDSNGRPSPYQHGKVRVFFPTEENCPVPLILHGEFDLEQNRKHVRPGANRPATVESLARCVKSVLDSVRDDGIFLDLLTPREGMTGLDQEIWEAIKATVRDMPLPQSGVKVGDVRLCPEASAEGLPWSSTARLPNWQGFKEVLAEHRPGGLTGLPLLPPGVDNKTREKVICAFNPNAYLSLKELGRLPLFPVQGRDDPIAASDCPLFFPPKNAQLPPAPEGIRVGFIQERFTAACEKQPGINGLLAKLGVQEFRPPGIAKALAEQKIESAVPEALWDYLLFAIAPLLKDIDAVMDWRSKDRKSLAERVKVPCRGGEWKAAGDVYAGREWTNDGFLERAFGTRQDRAFLSLPPVDKATRKRFERLARWLGVGWSPKVLPVVCFDDKAGTKEGPRWQGGLFSVPRQPARWREHCAELNKDSENDRRKGRLRQDWTLDGDEQALRTSGAFACIVREWPTYKSYLEAVVYRSGDKSKDNDDQGLYDSPSYLSYLFGHVAWIPAEGVDEPLAAHDIFARDSEVQQALASWVFAPAGDVPDQVREGIGIRSSWGSVTAADWERWLGKAAEPDAKHDVAARERIGRLYKESLARSSSRFHGKTWSVQKRQDNTEEWHLEIGRDVFFIDRPDLARLRLAGIRRFPVELGRSENKHKVADVFGIQPLSEHLRGEAGCGDGEQAYPADRIRERLQDRFHCLEAYLRVKGKDAPTGTPPVASPVLSPSALRESSFEPCGGHRPPSSGGGGGGESDAHRRLKNELWEHPELIEPGMQRYLYEPERASHYRPDLILKDAQGRFAAVEVEAEFPRESDYGVWQAVAYKHVAAAEFQQRCEDVRGILAAPQIPESIKQKCRQLGVEPVEVGFSSAARRS